MFAEIFNVVWCDRNKGGSPPDSKSTKEVSQVDKVKAILQEYGKVAILSHSTIWALSLAVTYAGFRAMDMEAIIQMLPARCGHPVPYISDPLLCFLSEPLELHGPLMSLR